MALTVRDLQIAFPDVGTVLAVPELDLPAGSAVAVQGPSGAGKSSLLHALAGIERPASGTVRWDEVALWSLPAAARDRWRRERLGLVFQDMHLLDGLSALENVLLPLRFDRLRVAPDARRRATALLARLGIADPGRRSAVMSRGERQRVALARALLRQPAVILADEPTASLDDAAAAEASTLLLQGASEAGATLLVATHDHRLLDRTPLRLRLQSGRLERVA